VTPGCSSINLRMTLSSRKTRATDPLYQLGILQLLAVGLTRALMLGPTAGRRLVARQRMQSLAEMSLRFIAKTIRSTTGEHGPQVLPAGVFAVHVHSRLQLSG